MVEVIILLDMGFYSVWGLWNVSRMRERENRGERKEKGIGRGGEEDNPSGNTAVSQESAVRPEI